MRGGERLMPMTHKIVKVLPDSELSLTLQAARTSGEPVLVDTGEGVYTLFVAPADAALDDVFAGYDPAAAVAGLRALQDAFAGVDRDQLLDDLRAQRAQASAGRPA
jgi:hypothetical protein